MFPDEARFSWFERKAGDIIAQCRRTVVDVPGYSDTQLNIYVPGGDDKYPSFWIRDAVMQCRSGLIGVEEMQTMLDIALVFQNGEELRQLENGLRVPPWSIPDHINLRRPGLEDFEKLHSLGAVFFPGSYSPGANQGHGAFGTLPAADDIYEVVELSRLIHQELPEDERCQFLKRPIGGVGLLERLDLGMSSVAVDAETGLCVNTPTEWSASSFHDALKPMGLVAFTSCLRFRAAQALASFHRSLGNEERADTYQQMCHQIADAITRHLYRDDGWLNAGSEMNRQPDLWATSMAVYYKILSQECEQAACEAMLDAYRIHHNISYCGYLRHTPVTADVVPGQMVWEEQEREARNHRYGIYQFGGYWPQPVGYFAYCLAQIDGDAAREIASAYIDHTQEFEHEGAPFEWINPTIPLLETPALGRLYGPSITLPLEAFRRLKTHGARHNSRCHPQGHSHE